MADDLITLAEFLAALDKAPGDLDSAETAKYEFSIKAASQAIRNYTGRTFELATGTPSDRTFLYDGSGYLDINDCVSVVGVTNQFGAQERPLLGNEYMAQPFGGLPVFEWIQLAANAWGAGSPQMGFQNNLDKLYDQLPAQPVLMVVSADWGWPSIPFDVRQAALWTATALSENPRPYISESIEGYSRSMGGLPTEAITDRAMAALTPYEKLKV